MAHFARLDHNNMVINVVKVNNSDCVDSEGIENEQVGINFLQTLFGQDTIWRQTSYNNNFRKHYACIGYRYDTDLDAFISPKPYPSWIFNSVSLAWDPPVPPPEDITETFNYEWDEINQSWQPISMYPNT